MMEKKMDMQPTPVISAHTLGEVIRDFSTCLSLQRDMGVTRMDLSPETVGLMDHWQRGKLRPMARPAGSRDRIPPRNFRPHPSDTADVSQNYSVTPQEADYSKPPKAASPISSYSKPPKTVSPISSGGASGKNSDPTQNPAMPAIHSRGTGVSGIFFLCDASTLNQQQQPDITLGPAGELFLNILKAMHLDAEQAHIISFIAPSPQNDTPDDVWQKRVKTHVFRKMKELNPRIICTMGEAALQVMLGNNVTLAHGEGRFHNMATALLIPTYHPARLIEDPSLKRPVWESMKRIMQRAGQN